MYAGGWMNQKSDGERVMFKNNKMNILDRYI